MRSLVLAAALVGGFGCGKQINPAWCQQVENQASSDCPSTISDAAVVAVACTGDPACQSDPINKFCLMPEDVCVECRTSADCHDGSPICTENKVCLPCQHDFECGSGGEKYCDTDGQCQMSTSAVYSSPAGTGKPTDMGGNGCTETAPCNLTDGITQALSVHKLLRLEPDVDGGGLVFHLTQSLSLGGAGVNLRISGSTDLTKRIVIDGSNGSDPVASLIKISGGTVELDYLALQGAKNIALQCSGGTFIGHRLYIHDTSSDGGNAAPFVASSCAVTLDASVIMNNAHGGLDVNGATAAFAIHNSVIANNRGGAAVILHGNGSFTYNTVADNQGDTGTSGVSCDHTSKDLDMNLLVKNTLTTPPTKPGQGNKPPEVQPSPQYQGCGFLRGYADDKADLKFLKDPDPFLTYHLTKDTTSDVVNISEANGITPNCTGSTDIDLNPRPTRSRCDMGADECDECTRNNQFNFGYPPDYGINDDHGNGGH